MKILTDDELTTIKVEAAREGYVACLVDYRPRPEPAEVGGLTPDELNRYQRAAERRFPFPVDTANLMSDDSAGGKRLP